MNDHDHWTELAATYALGALEEPERSTFEAHVEECAQCRADLSSYADAVHGIALTAPRMTPPSALRERIVASARAERSATAAPQAARPAAAAGRDAPPVAARPRMGVPPWAAAAAVVAALIAGGLWLSERRSRTELENALAGATSELDAARATAADVAASVQELDAFITALMAPDLRTTTLTSDGAPPSARFHWSPGQGQVVLAAFDLPPAPAGRTYQLWGIAGDGRAFSLGTFDTQANGQIRALFSVPPNELIEVGAVTEEPAGGSPQPTTTPFLAGTLAAL
jgi:anti-sigma-K factor RskA